MGWRVWLWGRSCSSEQQGTRGACSRGSGGKHVTTLAQWEERKLLGGTHTPAAGPLSQLLQERAVPPEQLRGNTASGERRCKWREEVQVEREGASGERRCRWREKVQVEREGASGEGT